MSARDRAPLEMKLSSVWPEVQEIAHIEGAMQAGVSSVDDFHSDLFGSWIARGHAASMQYLNGALPTRRNPRERFPWAESVIVITVPYSPHRPVASPDSIASHIARYALGDDYHLVLDEILRKIEECIRRHFSDAVTRRYVDTGPLSDRSLAAQAGLGWIGKNGMLIDPERGSYFFIGTILTSLINDVEPEPEVTDRCGTCTRCVDACPTDAILPDRTLDSSRCISYATIEHRGPIEAPVKDHLEGNLFGCDICQEVCPWNAQAPEGHARFQAREEYRARPVSDLLKVTQSEFSELFRKSAIKRAKRNGMIRNAILIGGAATEEVAAALRSEGDEGIVQALRAIKNPPP